MSGIPAMHDDHVRVERQGNLEHAQFWAAKLAVMDYCEACIHLDLDVLKRILASCLVRAAPLQMPGSCLAAHNGNPVSQRVTMPHDPCRCSQTDSSQKEIVVAEEVRIFQSGHPHR